MSDVMTVGKLIEELAKIPNKNLPVKINATEFDKFLYEREVINDAEVNYIEWCDSSVSLECSNIREFENRHSAICKDEAEKYDLMAIIRGVNSDIQVEPSGCGDNYYLAFECTDDEYDEICRRWIGVV